MKSLRVKLSITACVLTCTGFLCLKEPQYGKAGTADITFSSSFLSKTAEENHNDNYLDRVMNSGLMGNNASDAAGRNTDPAEKSDSVLSGRNTDLAEKSDFGPARENDSTGEK